MDHPVVNYQYNILQAQSHVLRTLHNHYFQKVSTRYIPMHTPPLAMPKRNAERRAMPEMCNFLKRLLIRSATRSLLKALATDCQRVEWIDPHHFHVGRVASEVESDDDHEIGKDQDTALEVIALQFKCQYNFRSQFFFWILTFPSPYM